MKNTLPYVLLILLALLFATATYTPAYAENASSLAQKLKQEKRQAEEKKKKLSKLKRKAQELKRAVSQEEASIAKLSRAITEQEKKYSTLAAQHKSIDLEYKKLEIKNNLAQSELISLVKKLWPLYINSQLLANSSTEDWDEMDRRYMWASTLYASVETKQRKLMEQQRKLKRLAAKQKKLSAEAKAQLAQVNNKKDELLKQRLQHSRQLKQVSAQKASAESSLRGVLSIIDKLNYKIEEHSQSGSNIALLKGVLPWPARGVIARRFNPRGKPPVRGVGLALQKGSFISAVSGGRVVHNDVLRGFGRVVIVMHGEEYYSLYAFLASSKLHVGQIIKQRQIIGKAGFYPSVDGTGVYFELRFHQKPINPETWLSALN
jgi:septal ring factor EnvC (AmiA/AmiB activator)